MLHREPHLLTALAAPPAPILVQPAELIGVLPRVCVFEAPPRVGLPRQWPCARLVYQAHCVCAAARRHQATADR